MRKMIKSIVIAWAGAMAFGMFTVAQATMTNLVATLNGAQETPPNASAGTGTGTFVLDTSAHTLSYNVTFSGLGSAENAAHIHCCAAPGTPAGVKWFLPAGSPKIGTVTGLTAADETNVSAGLSYVNVHTVNFPNGEIRGQIVVPPTATPTQTPTDTGVPTATPTLTPTLTPTNTPTLTPTLSSHDSVVLPVAPVNVTLTTTALKMKKLHVKVRNADAATETAGHTIALTSSSDCPAAVTLAQPDFLPLTPVLDSAITVLGGKTKSAVVLLTIDPTGLVTFNRKAPNRCTLSFSIDPLAGNADPTVSNNTVTTELSITDRTDAEGSALHETVIKAIAPMSIVIPKNKNPVMKNAKPKVVNADISVVPVEVGVHPITLTVSNDTCGILGTPDFVPSTPLVSDNPVDVHGGATKTATVPLTVDMATFTTPNAKAPTRCSAVLTATGPAGDTDATNNTTKLIIDVIDRHDVP